MQTQTRTSGAAIAAASVVFALVAAVTMLAGSSVASAQTLNVSAAVIEIGDIGVTWTGSESIDDGHMTLNGGVVSGGIPDIGSVNILTMVDDFEAGVAIELLLVNVALGFTGCTVIFHGPLVVDNVGGDTYHAFFADASDLGGVLFSGFTCGLFSGLVSDAIEDGVLVEFEIGH